MTWLHEISQPGRQVNCAGNDEVNKQLVRSAAWSRNILNCRIEWWDLNYHEATCGGIEVLHRTFWDHVNIVQIRIFSCHEWIRYWALYSDAKKIKQLTTLKPTYVKYVGRKCHFNQRVFVATLIFKLEKNELWVLECIVGISIDPLKMVAHVIQKRPLQNLYTVIHSPISHILLIQHTNYFIQKIFIFW